MAHLKGIMLTSMHHMILNIQSARRLEARKLPSKRLYTTDKAKESDGSGLYGGYMEDIVVSLNKAGPYIDPKTL